MTSMASPHNGTTLGSETNMSLSQSMDSVNTTPDEEVSSIILSSIMHIMSSYIRVNKNDTTDTFFPYWVILILDYNCITLNLSLQLIFCLSFHQFQGKTWEQLIAFVLWKWNGIWHCLYACTMFSDPELSYMHELFNRGFSKYLYWPRNYPLSCLMLSLRDLYKGILFSRNGTIRHCHGLLHGLKSH